MVNRWRSAIIPSDKALVTSYRLSIVMLLITNRKSHIGFQMTRKSMSLDDLEDQYVLLWLNGAR